MLHLLRNVVPEQPETTKIGYFVQHVNNPPDINCLTDNLHSLYLKKCYISL